MMSLPPEIRELFYFWFKFADDNPDIANDLMSSTRVVNIQWGYMYGGKRPTNQEEDDSSIFQITLNQDMQYEYSGYLEEFMSSDLYSVHVSIYGLDGFWGVIAKIFKGLVGVGLLVYGLFEFAASFAAAAFLPMAVFASYTGFYIACSGLQTMLSVIFNVDDWQIPLWLMPAP